MKLSLTIIAFVAVTAGCGPHDGPIGATSAGQGGAGGAGSTSSDTGPVATSSGTPPGC